MTTQLMPERTRRQAGPKTPDDYRPTEDEPFMNTRQQTYFRAKLLAWRDEIVRSMQETRQHLHEETVQHPDLSDRASTETERGVELRARDRQRKLITKIDAALDGCTMALTAIVKKQASQSVCFDSKRGLSRPLASKARNGTSGGNAYIAASERQ